MQVPYCIQLQNGSFETPDIAGLKAYHDKGQPYARIPAVLFPDGETGSFFTQYPSGEWGTSSGRPPAVPGHWKTRKRRPVH